MRTEVPEQERARRQAVNRELRWRKGVTPRSESLMQRAPWEAEGISRRTWYRRHRPARGTVSSDAGTGVRGSEAYIETKDDQAVRVAAVPPAVVPQAVPVQDRSSPTPVKPFDVNFLSASTTVSIETEIENLLDRYDERAGFLEFDGGYSRAESEARSLDEIVQEFQWSRNAVWWERFHTALNARRRAA